MDQIITDICNAKERESIQEVLDMYSHTNGFHGFTYAILSVQPKVIKLASYISNYPPEWMENYNKNRFYLYDPVLTEVSNAEQSFVWSEAISLPKLSDQSFLVMEKAVDYNITNGLSIPINHFKGVSFHYLCHHTPDLIIRKKMMLMSYLASEQIQKIVNCSLSKKLTSRESECLIWTAAGKTSEEISIILGITTRTVNEHINNSMRKLNACNKTQAAFKALMQQEFSFSNIPIS